MDYRKDSLKQEYLKQSVMTAGPAELIVMLYDSCIKNLKLAEICYQDSKDIAGASSHLLKAQKIVMELVNCLDTSIELSAQLLEIYDYLLYAMRSMNAKKDFALLPEILDILVSMRNTWEQASKSLCCSSEVG